MKGIRFADAVLAHVRTEGDMLPADLLVKILSLNTSVPGMKPEDYHLQSERLNEATNRSWQRMRALWDKFSLQRTHLGENETGTSQTREVLLLPLFYELGYGRLLSAKAEERTIRSQDGREKSYTISHIWNHSPIHLVGCNVELDKKSKGIVGAAQASPHSMVQDFLNQSENHLWGFVSNGLRLRLLRDNVSFSRQAFIEFDLESMFQNESFADFALLWLVCHQTRVENPVPEECWLEKWARSAQSEAVLALDALSLSVRTAIEELGRGFLTAKNDTLRKALRSGELNRQEYFRQLLRMVYRLLFLFVAEDRNLLHAPGTSSLVRERFLKYYSTTRLRRLSGNMLGGKHHDLYEGLKLLMQKLGSVNGCSELGLSPMGGFLWSADAVPDLAEARITNENMFRAIRALAFVTSGGFRRPVDYKHLGARELGSIYESLLELHPEIGAGGTFALHSTSGNERKTTGSYYTPTLLINSLLDTALEPVLRDACRKSNPETALLSLKICDPACGSGHFLIAAAHRLAKRLAGVRTGDDEPGPDAVRKALREVIGTCLYGVDSNPMSMELCKVGLWMEALEPGKPLSFLDHHIRCGNSLVGTTPELIGKGLPDEAFTALEGDEKVACTALKKRNTSERKRGQGLTAEEWQRDIKTIMALAAPADFDAMPSDTLRDIEVKEAAFRDLENSEEYRQKKTLFDMWCAAFVMHRYSLKRDDHPNAPPEHFFGITQNEIKLHAKGQALPAALLAEVCAIAEQYRFFHWHIVFPEVFAKGGFDVMLGNPPWERIKLQEKEWFAERAPAIAAAPNAAARRRLISALQTSDPELYAAFSNDLRKAEGESHFLRASGRYPLCGRGDINVYTVFAETLRNLLNDAGRMGCVVPSGIATDDTTKFFFQDLMRTKSLVSLFDFENQGIFVGVHSSYKFCLLTSGKGAHPATERAEFVFFAHKMEELLDKERRFSLSDADIALLNPNTRTCPIFRTRQDAELIKAIYRRVPVLIRENEDPQKIENPWGIRFGTMFHMSNDSHIFCTKKQLEADGWELEGNVFTKLEYSTREDGEPDASLRKYLPLYESKRIHHFNHRWATYDIGENGPETRNVTPQELENPSFAVQGRYWVSEENVDAALANTGWDRQWLMGWRDITNSTNERTVVGGAFPASAVGNNLPIWTSAKNNVEFLPIILSSLSCDFIVRFKVGGTHLNFFIAEQIAVLPPQILTEFFGWNGTSLFKDWLRPRILELTYTAWDMKEFAHDLGYEGKPFVWNEDRRFHIRNEMDAAFFHLYLPTNADGTWKQTEKETAKEFQALQTTFPTPHDAVEYVMETFPIIKKKDMAAYGIYRTKEAILQVYDAMQEAMRTGQSYESSLFPTPTPLPPEADPLRHYTYKPSPAEFPYGERETRVTACVPLLMRDYPNKGFYDCCEAMLLATNPELCKDLLPTHRRKGFEQELAATSLKWSFPPTDKIRFQKIRERLTMQGAFIGPANGVCRLPENFDFTRAPSMAGLATYLFEALQATKVETKVEATPPVTLWEQFTRQTVEIEAVA